MSIDKELVLAGLSPVASQLKGARIFITGGTGFFGRWLSESFLWLNQEFQLGAEMVHLVRSGHDFHHPWPEFARLPFFSIHQGDIRNFDFPTGRFSHVIHAAASGSPGLDGLDHWDTFETISLGTQRVLEFARQAQCHQVLYVSSGAIYGNQPASLERIGEDYFGGPVLNEARLGYSEGKRVGELVCRHYFETHALPIKIARCFGFMGPFLPLNRGFALGNFIQDCLLGRPIQIQGDGTNCRSYLYAADLAVWLWTILIQGKSLRPYNVGSDEPHSVLEIAEAVRTLWGGAGLPIQIARAALPGAPIAKYVPSTERARTELGVVATVKFIEGIKRTVEFYRS